MSFHKITSSFSAGPQLTEEAVAKAAAEGYRSIFCMRPDEEEAGQPSSTQIAEAAARHGLEFASFPVAAGQVADSATVARMAEAFGRMPHPVLGYCRTGQRAVSIWALSQSGILDPDEIVALAQSGGFNVEPLRPQLLPLAPVGGRKTFSVVIVGGGAAGISVAASLLKRQKNLSVVIIDGATEHYYQPGWTMVGAGVFSADFTRRSEASVIPAGAQWLRSFVRSFSPASNEVVLVDGMVVEYSVLIVAAGIKLDWDAIPGLRETLGKNGVTSNYRYDLAPYTYCLAKELRGGRALFTQPPMPIKCAGAPQKAMYLSCDIWQSAGVLRNINVQFHNAGGVLFGVAAYVPALMKYVERYGISLQFGSKLVAVDGPARTATFEKDGERIEQSFDMLHVVPPQVAPDVIAHSELAGKDGFVEVDPATMRHVRFSNIYALGDVAGTSNAKTAAAARKQAPVVAGNVLATLHDKEPDYVYDGYGSCPLTVERGRIVLAEFGYGGKLLPTFPKWLLDGLRPTRTAWILKARVLPSLYWNGMLKGKEIFAKPTKRSDV
ncbi:Sulfide-quinone reductase [Granulibacter bethesdensis]|uniref:bifunctional protein tyrosine phosphatase family protein/NAD(P)/FAD-dependent oxidoreductase n=1 Tax=Granulibacter bethesdensis TaxID=364410 RepID=UPI00090C0294|nr:bifunctional protein tyrosine phosphatase family protein/NAD(P)/FAD-dependent oxidoreductase [Granulibacter bethesdensis]APH56682.1 Sulfide-quinone reductase [Granulibacter bethesdensis]